MLYNGEPVLSGRLNYPLGGAPLAVVTGMSRCPKCAANFKDNHGDNFAEYSDGSGHCFSCSYHRHARLRDILLSKAGTHHAKNQQGPNTAGVNQPNTWSTNIPQIALDWLQQYGITQDELRLQKIVFDHTTESLILPLYRGGVLQCYQARYFGAAKDRPKYKTVGTKAIQVYPAGLQPATMVPAIVLVEDIVSAIAVGRTCPAVPLLGSNISGQFVLTLAGLTYSAVVWLDKDKAAEAASASQRIQQYLPCRTIITEMDPKCYARADIESILSGVKGIVGPQPVLTI